MRTVGVVTGTRADYGILVPVLRAIEEAQGLALRLLVCGAHLAARFGRTVDAIEADGFAITERIETVPDADGPESIAKSIGTGVAGFAASFAGDRPDLLLVLGDRSEMLAAAVAALPFNIPIAHVHGGESSEGAMDESIRHALTKMSHLHFVSTEAHAQRVIGMGEQPERVFTTGAPGLDAIRTTPLLARADLERTLAMALDPAPLVITFHPVTLEFEDTPDHIAELLAAIDRFDRPAIFTYPNADTWGGVIIEAIEEFVAGRADRRAVPSLGSQAYFSLMAQAAAMVGNSSSGIIEAANFALPVVDVGTRQRGRLRAGNVVEADCGRDAIAAAIERVLDPSFREGLDGLCNPYGDGRAAGRIVAVIEQTALDRELLKKRFHTPSVNGVSMKNARNRRQVV